MFGRREIRVKSPFVFGLVGALGTVAFFLVFWGLPNTGLPVPATVVASMLAK
jgi:putative flippase GtrA